MGSQNMVAIRDEEIGSSQAAHEELTHEEKEESDEVAKTQENAAEEASSAKQSSKPPEPEAAESPERTKDQPEAQLPIDLTPQRKNPTMNSVEVTIPQSPNDSIEPGKPQIAFTTENIQDSAIHEA